MALYIVATDGVREQRRKLKESVTLEQAELLLEELYEDDYLGLSWHLYDESELIMTLEH